MKKISVIFLLCVSAETFSEPVTGASQTWYLSAIYAEAVKYFKDIKKTADEAKITSDTVIELRDQAKAAYKEYKWIKGFDIDRELKYLKNDFLSITFIDDLLLQKGLSKEEKIRLIDAEIDMRFKKADLSDADREKLRKQYLADLNSQELQRKKLEEAERASSGKMTTKEAGASTASSLAILAALELKKKQEREKRNQKKKKDEKSELESYAKFFDRKK